MVFKPGFEEDFFSRRKFWQHAEIFSISIEIIVSSLALKYNMSAILPEFSTYSHSIQRTFLPIWVKVNGISTYGRYFFIT